MSSTCMSPAFMKAGLFLFLCVLVVTLYQLDTFEQLDVWSKKATPNSGSVGPRSSFTAAASESQGKGSLNDDVKHFIMHVGPQKTGTSFIQGLARSRENTTLREDNYYYDGMFKREDMFYFMKDHSCRKQMIQSEREGGPIPSCLARFRELMRGLNGKNVLFSCETLYLSKLEGQPEYFDVLQRELRDLGYKLLVVTTYRRLYDWMASIYNEKHRGSPSNTAWGNWRANGGTEFTSFYPNVMSSRYVNKEAGGTPFGADWTSTHVEVVPESVELRMMNMHESQHSMQTKFFCNMVPGAVATCKLSQELEKQQDEVHGRPSQPVWYDKLALAAEAAQMINTSAYNRVDVTFAIMEQQEETLGRSSIDFPWLCPPQKDLDLILQSSLEWEMALLAEEGDEQACKDGFWRAVEKKKLCDLDTDAVLQMEEWEDFFKQYSAS